MLLHHMSTFDDLRFDPRQLYCVYSADRRERAVYLACAARSTALVQTVLTAVLVCYYTYIRKY